ncbi:CD63 antigen-like isoform X1 [Epinephelus lanceolatus]|uniref:CD63 antigen-like n=1 Tax=Epinephelus lanceolatus TaxID=310571 RepID=UPI0014465547|nr:CD63 antigen-like [Epinephelus lanceolatus]
MCTFCSFKCCFVFFNMLFLASGVALIVIGVQQHSTYKHMGEFAGSSLSKISIVLIAVGITIALVSILGHLGAFFNSSSMVSCFICILIVIIILELLTGGAFYIFRSRTLLLKVKNAIDYDSKARRVINEYSPEKRHTIDKIQEKFKCCGADGPDDWSNSVGWENHDAVPDSCCVLKGPGCGQDKDKVHTKGCIRAIKLFLLKNLLWVGAVCITLGVGEVFGVIVGVCLCLNIRGKNYETMS